jgi:hypothetical protein
MRYCAELVLRKTLLPLTLNQRAIFKILLIDIESRRVPTVAIPVNTPFTNKLLSSRNLVPTPPIRIPIMVAALFSRIVRVK